MLWWLACLVGRCPWWVLVMAVPWYSLTPPVFDGPDAHPAATSVVDVSDADIGRYACVTTGEAARHVMNSNSNKKQCSIS